MSNDLILINNLIQAREQSLVSENLPLKDAIIENIEYTLLNTIYKVCSTCNESELLRCFYDTNNRKLTGICTHCVSTTQQTFSDFLTQFCIDNNL